MGQLDGKVAVITGGGTGIGLAIAKTFASEGAEVVIVGRREHVLAEACEDIGHGARAVSLDVAEEDQVAALFDALPRVDVLVTCAGGAVFGAIEELPPSEWRRLFHARFFGQINCCHYAIPKMSEGSAIILCSGIAADAHVKNYAGGAAICGAVNGMGKSLAVDLAPRGIRVNVLSPGFIGGTTIDFNLEGQEAIDFVKSSIAATPLARPGEPEELAHVALFLATSPFVSGQVVHVDGGWTAA